MLPSPPCSLLHLTPSLSVPPSPYVLPLLQAQRDALGVTDVQLSLTSLEEVFLNIARKAEMEAAASSGSGEVVHVLDDGGRLRIPLGAELVQHPTTGVAYKVGGGGGSLGVGCGCGAEGEGRGQSWRSTPPTA